jgi:Sortase domain
VSSGQRPDWLVTWRRRLLPAASVVVGTAAAIVLAVSLASSNGDGADGEPPARRSLPHRALAAEHATAPVERRLVDVVDREAAPPHAVRIPAIGVVARVVALGLNPDGTMETPRRFGNTGWFKPGPEPGERGAAVVTGHVDSVDGPAVFYRLRKLRRGDVIRVERADGSVVSFRVEGLERWPKATFPTRRVFRRTPTSTLRLVTCSGEFDSSTGHYADNTIVYAARMRVRRRLEQAERPPALRDPARRDRRGTPHP